MKRLLYLSFFIHLGFYSFNVSAYNENNSSSVTCSFAFSEDGVPLEGVQVNIVGPKNEYKRFQLAVGKTNISGRVDLELKEYDNSSVEIKFKYPNQKYWRYIFEDKVLNLSENGTMTLKVDEKSVELFFSFLVEKKVQVEKKTSKVLNKFPLGEVLYLDSNFVVTANPIDRYSFNYNTFKTSNNSLIQENLNKKGQLYLINIYDTQGKPSFGSIPPKLVLLTDWRLDFRRIKFSKRGDKLLYTNIYNPYGFNSGEPIKYFYTTLHIVNLENQSWTIKSLDYLSGIKKDILGLISDISFTSDENELILRKEFFTRFSNKADNRLLNISKDRESPINYGYYRNAYVGMDIYPYSYFKQSKFYRLNLRNGKYKEISNIETINTFNFYQGDFLNDLVNIKFYYSRYHSEKYWITNEGAYLINRGGNIFFKENGKFNFSNPIACVKASLDGSDCYNHEQDLFYDENFKFVIKKEFNTLILYKFPELE